MKREHRNCFEILLGRNFSQLRSDTTIKEDEHKRLESTFHVIEEYLKENLKEKFGGAVKGGSFGKGAMLPGRLEMDIVVVVAVEFNNEKQYQKDAIEHLSRKLFQKGRVCVGDKNPVLGSVGKVNFHGWEMFFPKHGIRYDLIPAPMFLNEEDIESPDRQLYPSTSGSNVQRNFVGKQDPVYKVLVKIVKLWIKILLPLFERVGAIKPHSYSNELIMLDAFRKCYRKNDLEESADEVFTKYLYMISNPQSIQVNLKNFKHDFKSPFVIDVADSENEIWSYQSEETRILFQYCAKEAIDLLESKKRRVFTLRKNTSLRFD